MSSLKCIYSITKLHAVYTVYYTAVLLCSEIAWSALWSLLLLLILLASSWLWYCLIVWERWIICWKLKKRQCPLGQMTPPAPISIRWWLQSEHNSYALDLECLSKFYQAKNNNKIWIKHTSSARSPAIPLTTAHNKLFSVNKFIDPKTYIFVKRRILQHNTIISSFKQAFTTYK